MSRLAFLLAAVSAVAQAQIVSLSPASVQAGSGDLLLTVNGGPFDGCSIIRWDGTPQPTTFVTSGSIRTTIPAVQLLIPRPVSVTTVTYVTGTGCMQALPPSAPVTFFVTAPPLTWQTNPQLPSGTRGVFYQTQLVATGGSPLLYVLDSGGSAPPGMGLAANGILSGTPTQAGTFSIPVVVTDCAPTNESCTPQFASRTFSLTINSAATPLTITTGTLPAASACAVYSATITATGGTGSYTWSATGVPQGLTLNPQSGVLSGTPPAAGSYTMTVTVRDAANATAVVNLTLQVGAPSLALTTTALPGGRVGASYSGSLAATGGVAPYTFLAWSDGVPGLSVAAASGALSGTPTQQGTFGSVFAVRDSTSCQVLKTLPITIQPPLLTITTPQAPQGFQNELFGAQFQSSGGAGNTRTWSIATGFLPGGLTLNAASGLVSGTPTVAGSFPFELRVSDGSQQATKAFTIVILPPLVITTQALPDGSLCSSYSAALAATGGVPPYAWSAVGLPAGLSINAQTGLISGTAAAAGTYSVVVTVRDQEKEAGVQKTFSLVFPAITLAISTASLPGATVNTAYSATLAASGGTPPYVFAAVSDVPPGISVSAAGLITGTPSQAGTFNTVFSVRDGAGCQVTKVIPIAVTQGNPLTITTQQIPLGFQGEPYQAQFQATGGTGSYTWSIASGNLPAGLTLNAASGLLSGTPAAAGTFPFEVRVTDSNSQQATRAFTLQIVPALVITTEVLPTGSACATYSATVTATGGAIPLIWSAAGLPNGLTINASTGVISGSVNASGVFSVVVSVRDQVRETAVQKTFALTLNASSLALLTSALPAGSPLVPYSAALSATGGSGVYTFALEANGVPGLTLASNGTITGTPVQAGFFSPTFRVTDSLGCTATRTIPINIGQTLAITTVAVSAARVNQPYSFQVLAEGGSGARNWSLTFGALPTGLTLDIASGLITGTPQVAGDFSFQVRVTDSTSTAERFLSITVSPGILITLESLPAATQGRAYSATVTATGGAPPLRFAVPDLPPGLVIDINSGVISGIPTVQGTFTVTLQVTDAIGIGTSKLVTLTVNPELRIVTDTLPAGQTGTLYSQTLVAAGGLPPYTWTLIAPPDLPRGLTLNGQSGQVSGTPLAAADANVRFRVTDQNNTQVEKLIRVVVRPSFFIQTETIPEASVNEAYTVALEATGGVLPVTWSIETGTLPAGLALDSATGVLSGRTAVAGSSPLNVLARDAAGNEARKTFSLVVRGPLTINPSTVPPGEIGVSYSQAMTVTGTNATVSLLLSGGALPAGLRLEGLSILGTPSATGTFVFTVRATDTTGQVATRNYTIAVAERLVIATDSLPLGGQGDAFSASLDGTGGDGSFTWSLSSGALPAGLALNPSTGAITGTPTQAGTFNLTFQLRDGVGRQTTRALTLRVTPILLLAPGSLSAATVGVPVSQAFTSSNATAPSNFSVAAGNLPPGLTLTAAGLLSGTPTTAGSFGFTVAVADGEGARGQSPYSLTVNGFPPSTVTIRPAEVPPGQQQTVTIDVANPLPAAVDGVVRLTFVAEDGGPADPAMGLNTPDRRTATFRLTAGQTQAVFPSTLMLQSGTVAGTITLTVSLTANGVNVTPNPAPQQIIRIPAAAPVIDSIVARRAGNAINVEIVGFATGREVASAEFQFTGGTTLTQSSFTVQTAAAIRAWFQDARAVEFGSLFKLTMPFTITGDANQITQVSVVLVNGAGRSTARQVNVQ